MPSETRYISEWIKRPAADVYDYASDPANIASWARGLGESVENVNGRWFVVSSTGRLGVAFAERNPFGVLDHEVTLPTGEVISVPMRVVPNGDGSEVMLTLRRQAGVSDEDFERDAGTVQADLTRLKHLLEASG
jgi:hypothetical protein